LRGFNGVLKGNAWPLTDCTGKQILDAFMYGAGLLHKFPAANDADRKRFLKLYDTEKPHKLLFALNSTLGSLGEHVSKLSVVIYREYAQWQHTYRLPLPDVRWHARLFNPFRKAPAPSEETKG
jgi:hypothetical protein